MRVLVDIEETILAGDHGDVAGIIVRCSRCGEHVEVFGTSDSSVRRGCVMLKEQCGEFNFYITDLEE